MTGNLWQDWPAYVLFGGFVIFVVFAAINSRLQEKKDNQRQNKSSNTK